MRLSFVLSVLILTTQALAKLPEIESERLANVIFKIENSKQYPYGIKSIPLKGNTQAEKEAYARKACIQTINNNHDRWIKAGKKGFYIDFLANKYCPVKDDSTGNKNWKKNVRALFGEF